jgi:hypothetical protein
MAPDQRDPRETDEWRVEIDLEGEEGGASLGERLRSLDLDDEARERLGGSVIVTRDGNTMFLYAWHEPSAREAERVARDLMEEDGLAGQVQLMRWHPVAEQWRPAGDPLPENEPELTAEEQSRLEAAKRERRESGEYAWEVVIHVPHLRDTFDLAHKLEERGLPVKRRWRYVLVGTDTEEGAMQLGEELEGITPEGCGIGIRANPENLPHPGFVQLGSLEPGALRDLGI